MTIKFLKFDQFQYVYQDKSQNKITKFLFIFILCLTATVGVICIYLAIAAFDYIGCSHKLAGSAIKPLKLCGTSCDPTLSNEIFFEDRNIYKHDFDIESKLICYYIIPDSLNSSNSLNVEDVDPDLCTHIIVGFVTLNQSQIIYNDVQSVVYKQISILKTKNKNLKILLSVGGGGNDIGFAEMIQNHANRKLFIQSLKKMLLLYHLDGVDLDWEFPNTHSSYYPKKLFNRQRQHFSQLLYEIRKEYKREKKNYLLSVAVAAPVSIVDLAYDVSELNKYVDFINIMTYDFHFYSRTTPFTGLNAPLYKQDNEYGLFATMNTNYSVNHWIEKGMDKNKIVIGLPTYGHSFTLVNPINNYLQSPSRGFGHLGKAGYTTYVDICLFLLNNLFVEVYFNEQGCSPFLTSGTEWISYENEHSISCKANYIKSNMFGGAMIYSLNSDDFSAKCGGTDTTFPLTRIAKNVLM